ncbi:hypothetical protein [Motiliproteus sediminis]|uniref:hypothetical protein n=1 Tax=Motiliproteus sediminis TaxID=1468178 RepID=UPI001AEF7FF8|nr:hypothetical protein [Motiliproteus sediminis]
MSLRSSISPLLALALLLPAREALATPASNELHRLLSGYSYQYSYGTGVSSSRPRITLFVHYCHDGRYFSAGQSCRPNLYASGYQCTSLQDQGQWQAAADRVDWRSSSGNQGSLALIRQPNGSLADNNGNPLVRLGPASCP